MRLRGLQALIFDVDGTLADTEELHRQAFNAAFGSFGLQWNWDVALYGRLLQVTGGKERIARYIAELPMAEAERAHMRRLIPELHAAKNRFYGELIGLGRVRPRAGVRRIMLEALQAGVRIGIASTTSPENIEPLIRAAFGQAALSWFSTIATGEVVRHKKPAPDIYNVAVAALAVPASAAVAVEDSSLGVESARRAGLFAVAVPCRWTRTQDFSSADLVLDSLGEPDRPLEEASAKRLGARYLSLEHLAALRATSPMDRRGVDGRSA